MSIIDFKEDDFYTYAMTEAKHCWQLDFLPKPTPCCIHAGGTPCEAKGCLVDDALNGRQVEISSLDDVLFVADLCHSVCRISSMSEDNAEFLQRMAAQGETHLLSIVE